MLYLDFHGHSRRKNTFLYGPNYQLQHMSYYQCRFLPKVIEKENPTFRYHSCNFNIPEDKKSTARAVMLN
jgi:cytosolic carboxypeptidase protein 2/3